MLRNYRHLIIGITGTFGSGKTAVSNFIRERYAVYNADDLAHQAINVSEIQAELVKRWGNGIITNDIVDRKKIAEQVFKNELELKYLNSLIHPVVLDKMQKIIENCSEKIIFFEVPLLFESNLTNCFDYIILVHTDYDIKLQRLLSQTSYSKDEINARLDTQMDDKDKLAKSDFIVPNNSTIKELESSVNDLLLKLECLPNKDTSPFKSE